MKISIITLFPKMLEGFFNESMVRKAKEKGEVEIELINLRDFAIDKRGTVDDRPYGGGVGMVIRIDVVCKALHYVISKSTQKLHLKPVRNLGKRIIHPDMKSGVDSSVASVPRNDKQRVILTSPKGKVFNQKKALEYAKLDHLIIIAGHYEGIDERVLNFVDEEVSIGDFVMTGGEIAAAAITDSVVRLLPGVLEKKGAKEIESFFEVDVDKLLKIVGDDKLLLELKKKGTKKLRLLEYPQYTRPEEYQGLKAPSILLSGNHQEIEKWRLKKAYEVTKKKRQDLIL